MAITPGWNREESGNTPAGSRPARPPNLSDLDETQPSMRRPGANMPIQPIGSMSFTPNIPQPPEKPASNSNSQDDSLVGTIFADRYEVLEMLGRGGMGSVYKARNRINKNLRALKLMHAHLVADPQVFRRFQQEATAAARIHHPNAINIIDMGMAADGRPYLVMDFLDGVSLSQLLRYKSKLSITESLDIFLQMCGALAEAHSHGVIHRDIKPSNVMILDGPQGEYVVKVVDFGIAKVFPQEGDPTMKDTTTGELFGSPPYMSPEQCLGKRLDYRSDIYSMGCLMYEVLTGAPPLVGQNALGTMYRQINEMPTPLSDIQDDVRLIQRLDEIISKTLQKNPDQRYQTILELHKDLDSAGEFSSKKVAAFSALGMKIQGIQRVINNSLGSAKRTVVTVMIMGLVLCSMGVLVVAPYVMSKDPTADERVIQWQPVSPPNSTGKSYAALLEGKERGLKFADTDRTSFAATGMMADFQFAYDKKSLALNYFQQLFALGEKALEDQPAPPDLGLNKAELVNVLSESFLKLIQCKSAVSKKQVARSHSMANLEGEVDLVKALEKDDPDLLSARKLTECIEQNKISGPAQSFIDAGVGLELIRRAGDEQLRLSPETKEKISKAADGDFQKFSAYWQGQEISPKQCEIIAPVFSTIGDYYLARNELVKANLAFSLARKSWEPIANGRGISNAAVAEDRQGRIQLQLGNKTEAIQHFVDAKKLFFKAANIETLDGAKVLYDQSDALWADREYIPAFKVHTEAAKIWSTKRTNSGS